MSRNKLTVGNVHARIVRPPGKKDPRPYWQAVVYEEGKARQVWSGRGTKVEVQRLLGEMIANDAQDRRSTAATVGSVGDLLARWSSHVKGREGAASSTYKAYRCRIRAIRRSPLAEVALERLPDSPKPIEDYVDARDRAGISRTTIGNELVVLRAAWAWGRERRVCPPRDLPSVEAKGRGPRAKYTPTSGEVAAMLAHLSGWPRTVVLVASGTGMRIGEIANTTWGDLDLEQGWLTVQDIPGNKTGARLVPLPDDLVADLRALRPADAAPEDRILPVARHTVKNFGTYLGRACEAAEIPRITSHAFRRYVTDLYARAKVDPVTSAAAMGNSPEVQWRNYRSVTSADMRTALKEAKLGKLPKGEVVHFPTGATGTDPE